MWYHSTVRAAVIFIGPHFSHFTEPHLNQVLESIYWSAKTMCWPLIQTDLHRNGNKPIFWAPTSHYVHHLKIK